VTDIAHEVIYRLKEGNSTKWLFSSGLTLYLEYPIATERNTATGLVIAPPVWELTDFFATKHPKKHQNGHLPGVNNHFKTPDIHPESSGGIGLDLNYRKI
jgi:hypothetical protein